MSCNRSLHRNLPEEIWALKLEVALATAKTSERSTRLTPGDRSVWIQDDPGAINSYSHFRILQQLRSTLLMLRFSCLPLSARIKWCDSMLKLMARLCCTILTRNSSHKTAWSTTWSLSLTPWTKQCRTSTARLSRSQMQSVTPVASWSQTWNLTRTKLSSRWVRWPQGSPPWNPPCSARKSSDWRCARSWDSRTSRTVS